MILDIKKLLVMILALTSYVFSASFVSKAAEPLERDYIIEQLKPYWGPGPGKDDIVDPDVKILETVDMGDHVRKHISYMVEDDDKAYAYILLPKPLPDAKNPAAAVVCPHPTHGTGKDIVCGVYESPISKNDDPEKLAQRAYALELVRMGFVCFAPDMAGYGERVTIDKPTSRYNFEHVEAFKQQWLEKWPGAKFPHYKQLWDIQRGIDVMCGFDFVDTDRVGIIGHSLGAWTAIVAAAYDTRIKAAVANAGGGLHFIPQLWTDGQALKKHLSNTSVQNLHNNMNAFIMLTAPRAFLYIKPYNDYVAYERAWPNHFEAFRIVADYYRQVAGGDDKYKAPFDIYFHNRTHTFEQDSRALAYGWLDKQLRGNSSFINQCGQIEKKEESVMAPKGNAYPAQGECGIKVLYDQYYTDDKKLDLYLPQCGEQAKRAAIVMIHGGGWVAGDKRQAREQRFGKVLASNGYLCVDIEYKLAGKDDPAWPQCLYDCKNAVKFLRKNAAKYNIDPEKIAVMGGSAGGHLALMTAFTGGVDKYKSDEYQDVDDSVCAVIDLYGITNALTWRYFSGAGELRTNTDLLTGVGVEENAQLWIDASPVYAVNEDASPALIMHGTADEVVSIEQSIELTQVLDEKAIEYEFIKAEGAPHSFTFDSTATNYWPKVLEFLEKHMN